MEEYELSHYNQHGLNVVGSFWAMNLEEAKSMASTLIESQYKDFIKYDGTNAFIRRKEEVWSGKLSELRK